MPHLDHFLPDEYPMETLDKISMEDKIILSREEDFNVRELTPGEIAQIINEQLRDLPADLVEESGPEVAEVCFNVAYGVINRMQGF